MKSEAQLAHIPTKPGDALGRFAMSKHRARSHMLTASSSFVQGYDTSSDFSAIPKTAAVVFEYIDGITANVTQVDAAFPNAVRPTITVFSGDALILDCEPGNISWDNTADAPNWDFVANWMHPRVAEKKVTGLYVGANWSAQAHTELPARGLPKSTWLLDSAHWTNVKHCCDFKTCGYAYADMTQYGGNIGGLSGVDFDLLRPGVLMPPVPPTPTPSPAPSPRKDKMFICKGSGPVMYFVHGGKVTQIHDPADLKVFQQICKDNGYSSKIYLFSDPQIAALTS